MSTPVERRLSPEYADGSPDATAVVNVLPEGLVDWLRPWRAPEDCLTGGLALARSAEVLLANVEAARQASMRQLYGLRDDRSGRRSDWGSISPRTGGGDHGASGRSSLAMKSVSAQRRARVGTTLLDLASCPSSRRSSIFMPDAVSPVSGRAGSSFASAMPSISPNSKQVSSRWSAVGDQEGRSEPCDSVRASRSAGSPLHPEPQSSPLSLCSARDPGTPSPPPAQVDDRTSPVPAIPRFSQFMQDKETLLKILESDPLPPPRRGRNHEPTSPPTPPLGEEDTSDPTAPVHYELELQICEDDEDDEDVRRDDEHSPPHPGHGGRTARPGRRLSVPSSSGGTSQGNEPISSPPLHSTEGSDDDDDDDGPEFDEEGNASEHNFGEGGHLACVPGDTLNNRYVLLRQLGVGRSSRVWLAVDLEQCSVARRQLIRVVGESLVRELSCPKDNPLFVAIKVFRCGDMYSACARYEAKMLHYINERVKVQSVQRHFTLGRRSQGADASHAVAHGDSSTLTLPVSQPGASVNSHSRHTPFSASQVSVGAANIACAKGSFTVEGDHGTHHCLVMDVLGTGVDAVINETNLRGVPLPIARSILHSALQGLAALASMSIIHTDLKPENLLFVDLDAKTATDMEAFQASHLGVEVQGGLWTGFTHRRQAVTEYLESMEKASNEPLSATGPGRVLFRVQVADFGLSLVVPPALRSGVAQLMVLGGPDVVALTPAAQLQTIRDCQAAVDGVARGGPSAAFAREESLLSPDAQTGGGQPTPVKVERVSVFQFGGVAGRPSCGTLASHEEGLGSAPRSPFDDSVSSLESETDLRPRELPPALGDRRFTQREVAASYDRSGLSSVLVSRADNDDGQDAVRAHASPLSTPDSGSGHVESGGRADPTDDAVFVSIAAMGPRVVAQTASYHSPVAATATSHRFPGKRSHRRDGAARGTASGEAGDDPPRRSQRSGGGEACVAAPRLSALYSCVVAPPTELEMDILQQQHYERGALVQSREYRAPEVILGDFFLPSCDVWSFGCIAYELVVGTFLMDPSAEYNDVKAALVEMECERRRSELQQRRRRRQRASSSVGSVGAASSQASLSITRRVSQWLGGLRGGGGLGQSDHGTSSGRASRAGSGASPPSLRAPPHHAHAVDIPSHDNSDEEEEEAGAAGRSFHWVDGIEDGRGSPAARPPRQRAHDDNTPCATRGDPRHPHGLGATDSDGGEEEEDEESVVLNSEEEEAAFMAVQGIYFDEYEKDMDVFHLKCAMRLLGPPPLAYLHREPEGLFTRDFFDDKGRFLFYDDRETEEKEYGIDQIRPLLDRERQLLAKRTSATSVTKACAEHTAPVTYDSLFRPGRAAVSEASLKSSPAFVPVTHSDGGTVRHSPPLDSGARDNVDRNSLGSATPSVLSLAPATAVDSATPDGSTTPSTTWNRAPLHTANYPVITPAWQQLQRDIRCKIGDEAEAVEFERLLRQCLQWDPAMRTDASALLQSRWMVAFGDLARE